MTPPADRLPGLDLLRSIAIVWVMLFHSFVVGGLGARWEWLSRFGWMGVDLFFVLSGFLIGGQVMAALRDEGRLSLRDLCDFWLRRALRTLPAYGAVLLLYIGWPSVREAPGMEPAWKFCGFVLNLSIDYARHPAFSHAWSLCVEEHFYLAFPLVAMALMRRPATWKFAAVCIGLIFAGIVLRSAVWWHDSAVDPGFERNWFVEDLYYPTWNRLDGLLAGVVLAACKVLRPGAWAAARRYADAAGAAGMTVLLIAFRLFDDRVGLLANAIGWPVLSFGLALLVFAAAGRDGVIGRRAVPGASALAAASYSLYLVHKAAYHVVETHMGAWLAGQGLVAFLTYGGAALLAGTVLHVTAERPFLRLRSRLLRVRRAVSASTVAREPA